MSNEKEILFGFLTKALNKSEDEIKGIIYTDNDELNENALDTLISVDANRIKKYKEEGTKLFDNGYKKAQKEILSDYESKLKETFGIDTDKIGDDLLTEIKVKTSKTTVSELTDDVVTKHPKFLEREKQLRKEKELAIAEKENEFTKFKSEIERTTRVKSVKEKAADILLSLNPVLSKDAKKAENQKKMFLDTFDKFDYQIESDNSILILKEGQRLETANFHPVNFTDFVKEQAESLFDFNAQSAKVGTGNSNEKKPANKAGGINMNPKTVEEYNETLLALEKLNDNAKIVEVSKNWKEYDSKK